MPTTQTNHAFIHQKLKRPGVTLQLLWEEYARGNDLPYRYTSFCVNYRAWAASLKRSMRQTHLAGERLFVDYAGQTYACDPPDGAPRFNGTLVKHVMWFRVALGFGYGCSRR